MTENNYTVISFYKFTKIRNIFKYKNLLNKEIKKFDIRGIILIAPEGVNISISILSSQKYLFTKKITKIINCTQNELKFSYTNSHIFRKLKIKVKREILTTRLLNQIEPNLLVGKYVKPNKWNDFISNPDVLLVDTRNYYETKIGSFKNAIDPKAKDFSDILNWIDNYLLKNNINTDKKIAMFCTGGIRCEKATSYLRFKGYKEVYHLEGGILKYLEESKKKSKWIGECFVFDNRVSVDTKLKKGSYNLCFACRMPLNETDKKSKKFVKGVVCPYCYGKKSKSQLNKYTTRNIQLENMSKNATK